MRVSTCGLNRPHDWIDVKPGGSGVYVYIRDHMVRYVGKTSDLHRRLQGHHALDRAVLRRIGRGNGHLYLYPCSEPFMSDLEGYLIFCFLPKLNGVQPLIPTGENELLTNALRELKELCNERT